MRLMLDTCVIIDLLTDIESMSKGARDIIDDHRDPSDHIIISHAITERMALMSSDTKFPFYRNQGLELIEY